MSFLSVKGILTFFLFAFFLTACLNENQNGNTQPTKPHLENTNTSRTNVEELSLLVKIPFETEDIVWKEDVATKKLIAVLRFSPADSEKLVAEAGNPITPETVSIAVESWFPDELTAQSAVSGDNSLKGVAYPATAFYQEPYTSGRITRIEGGEYFILELNGK